jgi:hypothetical protein
MSRPPVHRGARSPRGIGDAGSARGRYFGPDFASLVALAEDLARERHGIEIPAKGRGLARTLIEIPALLAHILGEHQSLYARESFIGSAQLQESLTRHARRLAYTLDAGVAATGLAVLTVKAGITGKLAAGFALQSSPKGEVKAQTYETLLATELDAAWNAMRPADATVPTEVVIKDGLVELPLLTRHGLDRGAVVLLEGKGRTGVFRVEDPFAAAAPPRILLRRLDGPSGETWNDAAEGFRMRIHPRIEARIFGWSANAALYPPEKLEVPRAYTATAFQDKLRYGYKLPADIGSELLLAETIEPQGKGSLVALLSETGVEALEIGGTADRAVLFVRGEMMQLPDPTGGGTIAGPRDATVAPGFLGLGELVSITVPTRDQVVESSLSARVTALALRQVGTGAPRAWDEDDPFPLDATLLADWADAVEVAPVIPNPARFEVDVLLDADLARMRPGRQVILRHVETREAIEARVASIRSPVAADDPWRIRLAPGSEIPAGWRKGSVEILGNVAQVSHGEAKAEEVGGSDGVTPHQAFALRKAPVTRVPSALGAEIALELRVAGVLWDRVEDFHGRTGADRVYRTETDAQGTVTVVFGGEGRGAVPPAGKRNIAAAYRTGLGSLGNIEGGRLSRIRKASPLIDAVTNPLPLGGGADPAGRDDIALQATRPVRVFDRAVSVADHADLALLFPGVARASARWSDAAGIELVAADAAGDGIADQAALLAFLDARRDTGAPLVLVDPEAVPVHLTLRVERDRAWRADAVRHAVEEALIGQGPPQGIFTFAGRGFSEPQSLSGLYARVLDIPGVAGAEALRFSFSVDGGLADILHASDRQWLTTIPADLDLRIVEPGLLTRDAGGGAP